MSELNVLIIGNGGREHALAWKLSQSPRIGAIFAAPGNAGTAELGTNLPIDATDVPALVAAAKEHAIDLAVVGPEAPLAAGAVDALTAAGVRAFGPTQRAAEIESSKSFARSVMESAGVRCAEGRAFDDPDEARAYVRGLDEPPVVKADGLAAGKGVVVANSTEEALAAVDAMMLERAFGEAGSRVVIEERLPGVEASVFAFCDGERVLMTIPACDYKRVFDGDGGPNTGGMGSYSPPEFLDDEAVAEVERTVIAPVVRQMAEMGRPYTGVLYAGLMFHQGKAAVLEFNCRLGDPETQVILPRLRTDLLDVIEAALDGRLDDITLEWDERPCVGIVMASGGYPGSYETGKPIDGLDHVDESAAVFYAGARRDAANVLTDGGRVLLVAALGDSVAEARARAYDNVRRIGFDGAHYRDDIAARAVEAQPGAGTRRREVMSEAASSGGRI